MFEAPAADVMKQGEDTQTLRRTMVERQLRPFDVTDVPLLERFVATPRELFLPAAQAALAYSDLAVTLRSDSGCKRTLLPPLVLARMLQGAEMREGEKVLDIGGAGYSAALLSGLAGEVVMVENDPDFAARAKAGLDAVGAKNVRIEIGPLEKGADSAGPYDVIIVQGAVDRPLDLLFVQLKPDGRMLVITRPEPGAGQQVVRFERQSGHPAGERPLFSAGAPILEGFQQEPAFAF